MDLLDAIRKGWGWRGIEPVRVIEQNSFGNVIVEDSLGYFWRICPENLDAKQLARSDAEFQALRSDPEFAKDWEFAAVTRQAGEKLGIPDKGRCYCLKIPAVLGGEYVPDNMGTIAVVELLSASGNMAEQIDDLPDGATVKLVVPKSAKP